MSADIRLGRRRHAARAPNPDVGFARIERRSREVDWQIAACRDVDPETFFPIGEGAFANRQAAVAKAVCARCHISARCLDWALTAGIREGIWGGHTEQERRALRRQKGADRVR